jgi:hypothetical protein
MEASRPSGTHASDSLAPRMKPGRGGVGEVVAGGEVDVKEE